MKYLIVLLAILIGSCSTEEDLELFEIYFQNDTNQTLDIRLYDGVDSLDFSNQTGQFTILPSEKTKVCEYQNEQFIGYNFCSGQIVFEFPNGKGHFCHGSINNSRCFDNDTRYIFNSRDAFISNGTEYTFHITQEDFENAYELP